jgi:hypothetical protein
VLCFNGNGFNYLGLQRELLLNNNIRVIIVSNSLIKFIFESASDRQSISTITFSNSRNTSTKYTLSLSYPYELNQIKSASNTKCLMVVVNI